MAQDDYGRYTGTGRPYHDLGSTTPEVELSESVRPWGKFLPAPYLPVGRFDVHKRANVVLSVGTPVGLDATGSLVPAGIPDGHTFEFDSDDYRAGMFASLNPVDGTSVIAGETELKCAPGLLGVSGRNANQVEKFVRPVGVTSYNVFSHEGGVSFTAWPSYSLTYDDPVAYAQHNSMAQDLVAITCDYCLLVPYIEGKNLLGVATKAMDNDANAVTALTKTAKSFVFCHDELITSGAHSTICTSGLSVVYVSPTCGLDDDGSVTLPDGGLTGAADAAIFIAPGDAVGSAVNMSNAGTYILYSDDTSKYIVLKNTSNDGLVVDGVNDGGTDSITAEGVLTSGTLTYMLTPPLQPGDHVVARAGKFVKFVNGRHQVDEIAGQILAIDNDVTNKSYLARVKSSYDRAQTTSYQMAGSATRGVPFNLHMVSDGAWRQFTRLKDNSDVTLSDTGLAAPKLRLVTINLLK